MLSFQTKTKFNILEQRSLKVSIITATYNSSETVKDTLESILRQTHKNIEHIIIDGLSKDKTLEIIEQYPHIAKVISEADKGIYDAMNKGLAQATGDIVGILNSDDFYAYDSVIEDIVELFNNEPIDAMYADLQIVNRDNIGKILRTWHSGNFNPKRFYRGWMPPHPTFFVRRSIYEQFGTFDTSFSSAADYELMLRLLLRNGVSVAYLPKKIVKMRSGGQSSLNLLNRIKAHKEDFRAWGKNGLKPKFYTLPFKPLSKIKQFFLS